MLIAYSIP